MRSPAKANAASTASSGNARRKNNVAKAWLYEYDGEEKLQGVAEGVLEVDKRVEEIIGLGFDDFKKCIALPQGEFAGLVKAKPSERLQLVSRLFDLEKYGEKLSAGIRLRCERSAGDAALIQAKMQENADGTPERIEAESEKLRIAFEKKSRTEAALSETETRLTPPRKSSRKRNGNTRNSVWKNSARKPGSPITRKGGESSMCSPRQPPSGKNRKRSKNACGRKILLLRRRKKRRCR